MVISNKRKENMTNEALENRKAINHIKNALDLGWMTYDEAKKNAQPVLNRINGRGKEVANKFGKKYNNVTFEMVMR